MTYFDVFDAFSPWIQHRRPSVYVISDSEMKEYKQKQATAEVLELKRLLDYHNTNAERLKDEISSLETQYKLAPANNETT